MFHCVKLYTRKIVAQVKKEDMKARFKVGGAQ